MGWWGRYVGIAPNGQARIDYVINEEGMNAEDERFIWKTLASSIKGAVIYFAIERTEKATGDRIVFVTGGGAYLPGQVFQVEHLDTDAGLETGVLEFALVAPALSQTAGPCQLAQGEQILGPSLEIVEAEVDAVIQYIGLHTGSQPAGALPSQRRVADITDRLAVDLLRQHVVGNKIGLRGCI